MLTANKSKHEGVPCRHAGAWTLTSCNKRNFITVLIYDLDLFLHDFDLKHNWHSLIFI